MPCYDGRDSRDREIELLQTASDERARAERVAIGLGERARAERAEALLCAVLTQLEKDNLLATVMSVANWDEAGISYDYAHGWWEKHKAMDEVRRKKEAEYLARNAEKDARKKRKQEVLAKLSPEERKILGV